MSLFYPELRRVDPFVFASGAAARAVGPLAVLEFKPAGNAAGWCDFKLFPLGGQCLDDMRQVLIHCLFADA